MFVSHDRGFIEDLATKVLELHPGTYRVFPGDYKYYMQRLEDEANGIVEVPAAVKQAKTVTEDNAGSATKQSWEAQKKLQSERRKIEREVERLEKEISLAEEKLSQLSAQLSDPAVYSDGAKSREVQKQIEEVNAHIEDLTQKWEEAAGQLE